MKAITYTRAAIRSLRWMPANESTHVIAKIELYADDPAALSNNVKTLKGRDGIRLRVGNWRVIMEDGVILAVLEIGARGSVYD